MKLYYMEGACSLAPHLTLEELGIPYEAIKVSRDAGDLDKPEFLKLNPMGAVPILVIDGEKSPLTENVAILPYLADLKKEKKLFPASGMERTRAFEWLAFLATSAHPAFGLQFGAESFGAEEIAAAVRKGGKGRASMAFDIIESKLPGSGYVLGPDYSVVDAYLYVFFSWAKYLEMDLSRWPKYSSLVSRITERPATLKILKLEDLLD